MSLSFLRNRLALSLCAVFVALSVGVTSAYAAALPTLGTRLYYILGSVMFGGMIHKGTASTNTTSTAGHIEFLPEFSSATTLRPVTNSTTSAVPYKAKVIAYVRASTGSTTYRYAAACFPNPLKGVSGGSGKLLRLDYHSDNNPAGVGGDIGFVKSCLNNGIGVAAASGSDIIDNTCTGSGCVSSYTTGTADYNNDDFIKFTPRANLTAGYTGRITLEVLNNYGE